MFTGIVQALGRIETVARRGDDRRFHVHCGGLATTMLRPGDSIAVNGVCLTVVEMRGGAVVLDVSRETLRCTTLGALRAGDQVNLEPALRADTPLGGHFVSGHVDGVGTVVGRTPAGQCVVLEIELPAELARYVAVKGSVCVDGVSLTVNAVEGGRFQVNIIPHTLTHTIIDAYLEGTRVNIEVDLLARYLERLLEFRGGAERGGIGLSVLRRQGFLEE